MSSDFIGFILCIFGAIAVLFALLACYSNLHKGFHWYNVSLLSWNFSINVLHVVAIIVLMICIFMIVHKADHINGYKVYCEFHSPKCEADNLTFKSGHCMMCSSSINESGVLEDRITGNIIRFSEVFNSYAEYQEMGQIAGVVHCAVVIIWVFAFILFRKGFKLIPKKV